MIELVLEVFSLLPPWLRAAALVVLSIIAAASLFASYLNHVERAHRAAGREPPPWLLAAGLWFNPLAGNFDKAVELGKRLWAVWRGGVA